jgi:homoserine kinase
MTELFSFGVPATTSHLGPGYGVLAIALDAWIHVAVQASAHPGYKIERGGTMRELQMDARHDEILRGFQSATDRYKIKCPERLTIHADSEIPTGCGLGTNTACFAAGIAAAVRFAKKAPPAHELLDLLVELGGDPAHGAAALAGGMTAACTLHAPRETPRYRIVRHPLHASWQFVFAVPQSRVATADAQRILPPTLPHAATLRTTSRVLGLLHALAVGDPGELRALIQDEVHVPFRQRLVPGIAAAIAAGYDAGADGVTISGHGPGIIAITHEPPRMTAIADAMVAAFAASGQRAQTLQLRATGQGALA